MLSEKQMHYAEHFDLGTAHSYLYGSSSEKIVRGIHAKSRKSSRSKKFKFAGDALGS